MGNRVHSPWVCCTK